MNPSIGDTMAGKPANPYKDPLEPNLTDQNMVNEFYKQSRLLAYQPNPLVSVENIPFTSANGSLIYYQMGPTRTLEAVAEAFKVTIQAVVALAEKDKWDNRVGQWDMNITRKIQSINLIKERQTIDKAFLSLDRVLDTAEQVMATAYREAEDGAMELDKAVTVADNKDFTRTATVIGKLNESKVKLLETQMKMKQDPHLVGTIMSARAANGWSALRTMQELEIHGQEGPKSLQLETQAELMRNIGDGHGEVNLVIEGYSADDVIEHENVPNYDDVPEDIKKEFGLGVKKEKFAGDQGKSEKPKPPTVTEIAATLVIPKG